MMALGHLREQHCEPPRSERLWRLLRLAIAHRDERLVSGTAAQLSSDMCRALDALVSTEATEPGRNDDQMALFLVRSDLASVKHDASGFSVEAVLAEIATLQRLRALELPEQLFGGVPTKLVTQYRQLTASEPSGWYHRGRRRVHTTHYRGTQWSGSAPNYHRRIPSTWHCRVGRESVGTSV